MVQIGSQKQRRTFFFKNKSYLACSQIWLILLPMDGPHFLATSQKLTTKENSASQWFSKI
jgi:hypothetical protein